MQFIQLRYFERVAAYQSISKAAEELHMSQPALSNSIRRLETDLGYPLFNRVGRQIILNNNGMRFLEIAKNILSYLNQCTLAEPRSSYQPAGTIHIGLYANVNDIVMAANNYSRINHNAQFQFHTTREVTPPQKKNYIRRTFLTPPLIIHSFPIRITTLSWNLCRTKRPSKNHTFFSERPTSAPSYHGCTGWPAPISCS